MIERRRKFWSWFFDKEPLHYIQWEIIPVRHIPTYNYIDFTHFSYRVNGMVFKRNTKKWCTAIEKERIWDKLHGR